MRFESIKTTSRNSLERQMIINDYIRAYNKGKPNIVDYDINKLNSVKNDLLLCGNCPHQFSILITTLHELLDGTHT